MICIETNTKLISIPMAFINVCIKYYISLKLLHRSEQRVSRRVKQGPIVQIFYIYLLKNNSVSTSTAI